MKTFFKTTTLTFMTIALLTSCEKTYECHCEKKTGGDEHIEVKAKKKDADSKCHELSENNTAYSECHIN